MHRVPLGLPLLLLVTSLAAGEDTLVPVRLSAAPGVADTVYDARREELKGPYEAATGAADDAEKRLRGAHGKKEEAWPAEVVAEIESLRTARDKAMFAYLFDATKQTDVAKALEGLTNNLRDNKLTPLVPSDADAVLVVKLLGRSRKSVGGGGPWSCVGLEITAGGKANPAAFQKLFVKGEYGGNVGLGGREGRAYHFYSAEEPFWHVDGCGQGMAWKMASNGGEVIIKKLAKQYNTALTASATK